MRGILSSIHRSLFPELDSTQGNPSCFTCILAPNEQGAWCASELSWCHGMRSGTQDRNKEGRGEMENLEKGNYKKHHVPRLPHVLRVQVSPFSVGRRAVGWLLVVVYWNPVSISESWSPLWGCSFFCWVHSEIFLHGIRVILLQRKSSFQEGFARWDGLTWDPKPSGFSTAI